MTTADASFDLSEAKLAPPPIRRGVPHRRSRHARPHADPRRERPPAGRLDLTPRRAVPVLGITGTGGSGKSSLTDELVRRFRRDQEDKLRIAVLAVDPTRRRGGGALLGDRIRMNALDRRPASSSARWPPAAAAAQLPEHLADVIAVLQGRRVRPGRSSRRPASGRATPTIVPFVDRSLYVMTPEFGAASQLEKIDMLDFADAVAINKFERRGAEDALRDVGRQLVRNREAFGAAWEDMPVFGTSAATLQRRRRHRALPAPARPARRPTGLPVGDGRLPPVDGEDLDRPRRGAAAAAGCATSPRSPRPCAATTTRPRRGRRSPGAASTCGRRGAGRRRRRRRPRCDEARAGAAGRGRGAARGVAAARRGVLRRRAGRHVRDRELRTPLTRESLSGSQVRRVALPRHRDHGELLRFLRRENLPGRFPFTAGVFPFKREGEDPARMFAGEGDAFRTNRRFHLLCEHAAGQAALDGVRLGHPLRPRPRHRARTSTARSARRASRSRRSTT